MAKDPAVLLYTDDFIAGTYTMTNAEVGAYIRMLCLQHQQGHLSEEDMLKISKKINSKVWSKFQKDDAGLYFNKRMDLESAKRQEHSKKQSDRALKRWDKGNETTSENDATAYTAADTAENAAAMPTRRQCIYGDGNGSIYSSNIQALGNEGTIDVPANDLSRVMTLYLDRINAEPSMSCIEMLKSYTEDMGGDVVCRAIEIAIDEKALSWAYIKTILQNWTRQKVKTISDVDKLEAERKKNKGGSNGQPISKDSDGFGKSKRVLPGVTKL